MKLFVIFLLIISQVQNQEKQEKAPKVPEVKMKHLTEFIENETNEKRRVYKSGRKMGAEIWDGNTKKYVKHGVFLRLHSNNSVREVCTWNYGSREGVFKTFNEKGNITKSGVYSKDQKTGEWLTYTKGRLSARVDYVKNKKNGKSTRYNLYVKKHNQPQFVVEYKNGRKHGLSEQFDDKERRVAWGPYVEGKRHGTWHEIGFSGKVRAVQWVNGKLQKK